MPPLRPQQQLTRRHLAPTASAAGWPSAAAITVALLVVTAAFVERKPATHRRVIVAVLPLKSIDRDPDAAYLGDGITIDLINLLGRIHPDEIGVIAPTSAMAYRNPSQPVREIAKQLAPAMSWKEASAAMANNCTLPRS